MFVIWLDFFFLFACNTKGKFFNGQNENANGMAMHNSRSMGWTTHFHLGKKCDVAQKQQSQSIFSY